MVSYVIPEKLDQEIGEFTKLVDSYKRGELNETQLKVHRVPFGVYEQRKEHTYMIRIRTAGGVITPSQLRNVAKISNQYADSHLHVTTRMEVQLHYAKIDNVLDIIHNLKQTGLSPRGGGGNTIRNIVCHPDAGIAKDDVFDVSPYAMALTNRMIREDDSWVLPRKFKIAFSGSSLDKGHATIHDLGFIATIKDGQKGFKVYVAGGMGAKRFLGEKLLDFVPESEVYNVTKAAKNLFHQHGNRKNKTKNRIRFLFRELGDEDFKTKFDQYYSEVKKENYPPLDIEPFVFPNVGIDPDIEISSVEDRNDFNKWKGRFVKEQTQEGLFSIIVPLELGDIHNDTAIALADFLEPYGENTIRFSVDQEIMLRNIKEKYLPNVYHFLKAHMHNFNRPLVHDRIKVCTGASTCKLGICLPRGAAPAISEQLSKSDLDLDALPDIKINISGCPNSCGQHHIGDIGFFGKAERKGDSLYPAYNILAGAHIKEGETVFGEKYAEISAKDMPKFVEDFFRLYQEKDGKYPSFKEYVDAEGKDDIVKLAEKYKEVPDFDVDPKYYFDWGSEVQFSLADRGQAECSAGMYDLIDMDFKNINATKRTMAKLEADDLTQKYIYLRDIIFYAARVLLISRAIEPRSEEVVWNGFTEHFINAGLVHEKNLKLIELACNKDLDGIGAHEADIEELAERMKLLFDKMDNNFNFNVETYTLSNNTVTATTTTSNGNGKAPVSGEAELHDMRGVACPMNFVKAKMILSKKQPGDKIEIYLDNGEPISNVPNSLRGEGHIVTDERQVEDGFWSIVVEKADPKAKNEPALKDYRGIACPMNFVKAKMELSKVKAGDQMEIYLDDGEPINNVPNSLRNEGHKILEQRKIDEYWSILVEKAN